MLSLARCGRMAMPKYVRTNKLLAGIGVERTPDIPKTDRTMYSEPELGPRQPHVGQEVLGKEKPRPYIPSEQVVEIHRQGEGDATKSVRVAVASYRGKPFVEIRQWEVLEEDDELLPSNKGINLTMEQYKALCGAIPQVEKLTKVIESKVKDEGW
eukprot:scpid102738/ scgid24198/ 